MDPECQHCGYDLRGLTEHRCPECGTAFDPAQLANASSRKHFVPGGLSALVAVVSILVSPLLGELFRMPGKSALMDLMEYLPLALLLALGLALAVRGLRRGPVANRVVCVLGLLLNVGVFWTLATSGYG